VHGDLKPTHENQNDKDDQDDADDPDAAVTKAVAIAAEAAAESTEQEDNEEYDEDKSKRHGSLLSGALMKARDSGPPWLNSVTFPGQPTERPSQGYGHGIILRFEREYGHK
jgi:hypothetical protein